MFSIRSRTFSGSSSFLIRSLGLSGSRCPSAHCPSPRGRRGARAAGAGVSGRVGVLLTAIAASSMGLLRCLERGRGGRPWEGPWTAMSMTAGASTRPRRKGRASSVGRTDRAAHAAVIDVATSHEAADDSGGHVPHAATPRPARPQLRTVIPHHGPPPPPTPTPPSLPPRPAPVIKELTSPTRHPSPAISLVNTPTSPPRPAADALIMRLAGTKGTVSAVNLMIDGVEVGGIGGEGWVEGLGRVRLRG